MPSHQLHVNANHRENKYVLLIFGFYLMAKTSYKSVSASVFFLMASSVLTSWVFSDFFEFYYHTVPKTRDLHTPALIFHDCSCFRTKKQSKNQPLRAAFAHKKIHTVVQIIDLFLQRPDQAPPNSLSSPPILTTLELPVRIRAPLFGCTGKISFLSQ